MESRNYLQFAAAGYYIQYLLSIYTIYCIRVGGNCPTEAHYYILPVTGELPHTGTLLTRELSCSWKIMHGAIWSHLNPDLT